MLHKVLTAAGTSTALRKWAKRLVRESSTALLAYEQLFAYGDEATIQDLSWQRLQVVWQREGAPGSTLDNAVTTFDIANNTGGVIDPTWITADYTTCETIFDTMFTSLALYIGSKHKVAQYRWYTRRFTPAGITSPGFEPSLVPARITTKNIPGTAGVTNAMPHQVAISVTEKTALPRNWGRFYLPGPAISVFNSFGMLTAPTNIGTPVATAYAALYDADFAPVVPSPAHKSLLTVDHIQVDDIADVQRRRRAQTPVIRFVSP